MQIQATLFCESGKYKPISTVVNVPNSYHYIKHKEYWHNRAKERIKAKRYWTDKDLEKYGYTVLKTRIYKES